MTLQNVPLSTLPPPTHIFFTFMKTKEFHIWDTFSNYISTLDSDFFYVTIVLVAALPFVRVFPSAHYSSFFHLSPPTSSYSFIFSLLHQLPYPNIFLSIITCVIIVMHMVSIQAFRNNLFLQTHNGASPEISDKSPEVLPSNWI